MNQTQEVGYFTETQLDRMNMKTMGNQLREPWDGDHLLSMLVVKSDYGIKSGLSPDEAKQAVVDRYCAATADEVMQELELMSEDENFIAHTTVVKYMHADPVGFQKALDAIDRGWRPGMPTKFQDQ